MCWKTSHSEGKLFSCPERPRIEDRNSPDKNTSEPIPETSQPIATRTWCELSATKKDVGDMYGKLIEVLMHAMLALYQCCAFLHPRCMYHCCLSEQMPEQMSEHRIWLTYSKRLVAKWWLDNILFYLEGEPAMDSQLAVQWPDQPACIVVKISSQPRKWQVFCDMNFPQSLFFVFATLKQKNCNGIHPMLQQNGIQVHNLRFQTLFSLQVKHKLSKHSRMKGEKGRPNGSDIRRSFFVTQKRLIKLNKADNILRKTQKLRLRPQGKQTFCGKLKNCVCALKGKQKNEMEHRFGVNFKNFQICPRDIPEFHSCFASCCLVMFFHWLFGMDWETH